MTSNHTVMTWKGILLAILLGWAYLPTLTELFEKWWNDPQYSHGILVPPFAAFLIYRRRHLAKPDPKPWPLAGYALLIVALAFRGLAAMLAFLTLDGLSLIFCITGLILLVGGRDTLRWTWQGLVFLLFMIPLPYQMERMMGAELQRIGTIASTFLLQILGQPAVSKGNLILIDDVKLGVVEACSGLRMLVTFLAFAVAAVMVMERHWIVKILVLASAVPIALLTNIIRIAATGMAHVLLKNSASKDSVMTFIHDFNGWMMMPLGLLLLLLELWLFKHLILEPKKVKAVGQR